MIRRQPAAIGIQRWLARIIKDEVAIPDVGAAFSLLAKTKVFDKAHDGDAKGVISHQDIYLGGPHPRLAERHWSRLSTRADSDIAVVLAILGRLAAANNPYRLLADVVGDLRRGDNHRTAAIRDHTTF